jgi:hypothetical protein
MVNLSIEQTTTALGVGQDAHRRVREAGVGWVRYWLSWEVVQPTSDPNPANWNWTASDYDIDAAIDQGLNVYVSIVGAPAWPHGGKPTYHWLQCFAGNDQFDETKPGCGPAGSATPTRRSIPRRAKDRRQLEAVRPRRGHPLRSRSQLLNEPTERLLAGWPEGNCRISSVSSSPGDRRDAGAALAANPAVRSSAPTTTCPTASSTC